MVTQPLSLQTQGSLRRQGYQLETTFGWDTHEMPLYVHRPGALRPVGSVGFMMRVGNLKTLDVAEGQYLARKGSQGFFLWPPEECMKHEFTPIEIVERRGGGVVVQKADTKVFGCKWCRAANPTNGLPGVAEAQSDISTEESSVRTVDSAPSTVTNVADVGDGTFTASVPKGVECTICGEAMVAVTASGKARSEKQQLHALKLHSRKHA